MFKKVISLIVSFSLLLTQPIFAQGIAELNIGKYLSQMPALQTDSFRPRCACGISPTMLSATTLSCYWTNGILKSHQVTKSPSHQRNRKMLLKG